MAPPTNISTATNRTTNGTVSGPWIAKSAFVVCDAEWAEVAEWSLGVMPPLNLMRNACYFVVALVALDSLRFVARVLLDRDGDGEITAADFPCCRRSKQKPTPKLTPLPLEEKKEDLPLEEKRIADRPSPSPTTGTAADMHAAATTSSSTDRQARRRRQQLRAKQKKNPCAMADHEETAAKSMVRACHDLGSSLLFFYQFAQYMRRGPNGGVLCRPAFGADPKPITTLSPPPHATLTQCCRARPPPGPPRSCWLRCSRRHRCPSGRPSCRSCSSRTGWTS